MKNEELDFGDYFAVDYEDGKGFHNKKLVFSNFNVVAQRSGLNNAEIREYQFEASLVSLTGTGRTLIQGSVAVNSDTKTSDQVLTTWYQIVQNRGPGTTRRNMKACKRRNTVDRLLKMMALPIHKDLSPAGPLGFTPDGEQPVAPELLEIPSFLRRP